MLNAVAAGLMVMSIQPPCVFAQSAVEVTLREGAIQPSRIRAKHGEEITIHVRNAGRLVHNFVVPDFYVFSSNLQPGEDTTIRFTPDKRGGFTYYSDKNGTPEPGMGGTLTVQ